MQFKYTDDEISEMLKNPYSTHHADFKFDPRIFNYWVEDLSSGSPYPEIDFKYHRYLLIYPFGFEDNNEFYVNDIKNPYFSVPLETFFELDAKGELPMELTRSQRMRVNLKIVLTILSVFALIGFAVAEFLTY